MDRDRQNEVLAQVSSRGIIVIFDRLCDVCDMATAIAEIAPEGFVDASGLRDVILKAEATAEALILAIKPVDGETQDEQMLAIESFKRAVSVRLNAVDTIIISRER